MSAGPPLHAGWPLHVQVPPGAGHLLAGQPKPPQPGPDGGPQLESSQQALFAIHVPDTPQKYLPNGQRQLPPVQFRPPVQAAPLPQVQLG